MSERQPGTDVTGDPVVPAGTKGPPGPEASAPADSAEPAPRALGGLLPRRTATVAAWSLALGVVGLTVWLGTLVVARVALVVVPTLIALAFAALLAPLNSWLRARGLPRAVGALLSVLVLLALLTGAGVLIGVSVAGQVDQLAVQLSSIVSQARGLLTVDRLPVSQAVLDRVEESVTGSVQAAGGSLADAVVGVTTTTAHILTGMALALFVVIFVLWDAARIWGWVTSLFPAGESRARVDGAGRAAWAALTGWVQGTFIIACIHAVVIGTTLRVLGVPLVVPLAILVFIGSFIPVLGAFLAGAVAVVVTLGTQGVVPAVVMAGILLLENELEAHVLQPFVVGRYVRLHPLAIILVLATGTFLAGFAGALLAVPIAGSARAAWGPLNGRDSVVPVGQASRLTRLRRWWHARREARRRSHASASGPA